jgi:hypothetical protein
MSGRPTFTLLVVIATALITTPALAAIESFDATPLEPSFGSYTEIDFENLHLDSDCLLPLPGTSITSIRIDRVTFSDPYSLETGLCSSPTCSPDPDSPEGVNNELFLSAGGSMAFGRPTPKLVVLDVQGIGDNSFELLVTGGNGDTLVVSSQGVLFGRTLLGMRASGNGIKRIDLTNVGGNGGPIALARILYSQSGH